MDGTNGTTNDGLRELEDQPLRVYLRDHFAGSVAGLALIRRHRRRCEGTTAQDVVATLEAEVLQDQRRLEAMMSRLGVTPSPVKNAIARAVELTARLKGNSRIIRPSPSSPVVELEAMAAGILTKRNLWRTLHAAAAHNPALDLDDLSELEARATSQLERVIALHMSAAADAFARSTPQRV